MGHPMTGHGTFEKTVRVGALRSLAWDWEIQDDSSDLNQEIGQRKHRFFGHSKRTHCFGTHPGRTARLLVPDAPGQGWCKVKVVNWNWMSDSWRFDALQGTTGSQSYWFKVLASSWECPDRTGTVWRCASGTAAEAALLFDRSADCTDLEQLPLTCAAIARTIPVLQTMYVTLCWSSPSVLESLEVCVN